MRISFADSQGWPGAGYGSEIVFLPAGSSSVPFTLTVPDGDGACSWLLDYILPDDNDGYFYRGYYADSGTTASYSERTLLPCGEDHSGIRINLIPARVIAGTITTGAIQANPRSAVEYEKRATVYGSPAQYIIKVPDVDNVLWEVRYEYDGNLDVVTPGYYKAYETTAVQPAATLLQGGRDYDDINLNLLAGNTISGTVSYPIEKIDLWGGKVVIIAEDMNGNVPGKISSWRNIHGFGPMIISYALNVPDTESASWRIKVKHYDFEGEFIPEIYYTSLGTSALEQEATLLPGGRDYSGIDLMLLLKKPTEPEGKSLSPGFLHQLLSTRHQLQ